MISRWIPRDAHCSLHTAHDLFRVNRIGPFDRERASSRMQIAGRIKYRLRGNCSFSSVEKKEREKEEEEEEEEEYARAFAV